MAQTVRESERVALITEGQVKPVDASARLSGATGHSCSSKCRIREPNRTSNTLFGLLQKRYSRYRLQPGKEIVMDTTTYASVAILPERIARDHKHPVRQDQELFPLDLSMIKR
jgi:hypothetical protein